MYSNEFMKFLINYQKPEYDKTLDRQVRYFSYKKRHNKLAAVFLLNKK